MNIHERIKIYFDSNNDVFQYFYFNNIYLYEGDVGLYDGDDGLFKYTKTIKFVLRLHFLLNFMITTASATHLKYFLHEFLLFL